MFRHRSGRRVASAIWLMPMVEELLASTACDGASSSRSWKIDRLTSRSSNTASITKSASLAASRRSVVPRTRSSASRAFSSDSLPFLDAPRDVALVGCARFAQLVLTLVVQDDVDAVQRGLLGDLRAHAARANDGQAGHRIQ